MLGAPTLDDLITNQVEPIESWGHDLIKEVDAILHARCKLAIIGTLVQSGTKQMLAV
jgi:hypothetical protein